MICSGCRSAAIIARTGEDVIWQYLYGRSQETVTAQRAAQNVHGACKGGTWCDCQHMLPVRGPALPPTLD